MTASAVCVIQARTGSSRLPGKVLQEVGGQPMLAFLLDRLSGLCVDSIVVATTSLTRDDPIVEIATRAGVECVRGSEDDVLARFADVINAHPAEAIVRLTGDCPLVDRDVVEAVLELHRRRDADYTCNVLPRTFPKGLDVEVARTDSLRRAVHEATDPREREHVMPYLYRHPELFTLANLRSGADLGDERWTVDTPDDLTAVRRIVDRLGPRAGWREILTVAGRQGTPAPGRLRLRPASADDANLVRRWRNDPESVRSSQSCRAVTLNEHRRWFDARLDDPSTRIWIAERDGNALGFIRIDVAAATGAVSIAVETEHRGKGLGSRMLRLLQHGLEDDFQVTALTALVRADNIASLRLFQGAGFRPVERQGSFCLLAWEKMAADPEDHLR